MGLVNLIVRFNGIRWPGFDINLVKVKFQLSICRSFGARVSGSWRRIFLSSTRLSTSSEAKRFTIVNHCQPLPTTVHHCQQALWQRGEIRMVTMQRSAKSINIWDAWGFFSCKYVISENKQWHNRPTLTFDLPFSNFPQR